MKVPAAFSGMVVIWATTPLAIKWSGEGGGFLFGVSARMVLGLFVCLVLVAVMGRSMPWHGKARATYLVAGIGLWGAMTSVYWAAQYIPSGLISVLFGMTPVVTGLMALRWLGERAFSAARVAGMALGAGGLALIFGRSLSQAPAVALGVAAVSLSVLIHSASAVWIKRIDARLGALETTTGALLIAVPLYLVTWALAEGALPAVLPTRTIAAIVYLAVFGSALGFILYFYVLQRLPASRVALVTLMTPVLALLIGQWINGEQVGPMQWAGTAAILFGLALYQWGGRVAPVALARETEG